MGKSENTYGYGNNDHKFNNFRTMANTIEGVHFETGNGNCFCKATQEEMERPLKEQVLKPIIEPSPEYKRKKFFYDYYKSEHSDFHSDGTPLNQVFPNDKRNADY